jgi:hypothetical protein
MICVDMGGNKYKDSMPDNIEMAIYLLRTCPTWPYYSMREFLRCIVHHDIYDIRLLKCMIDHPTFDEFMLITLIDAVVIIVSRDVKYNNRELYIELFSRVFDQRLTQYHLDVFMNYYMRHRTFKNHGYKLPGRIAFIDYMISLGYDIKPVYILLAGGQLHYYKDDRKFVKYIDYIWKFIFAHMEPCYIKGGLIHVDINNIMDDLISYMGGSIDLWPEIYKDWLTKGWPDVKTRQHAIDKIDQLKISIQNTVIYDSFCTELDEQRQILTDATDEQFDDFRFRDCVCDNIDIIVSDILLDICFDGYMSLVEWLQK